MRDVKSKCEKRVEKQDAFSVREDESASTSSLKRKVGDCVDEVLERVSVDAELSQHPRLVAHEETIPHVAPPCRPGIDILLQFSREFRLLLRSHWL